MKLRALSLVFLILMASWPSMAAFNAATAWDVRTTGADTNGGGFDTSKAGTDYSQQNAPQFSYADIVIGGVTTTGTSVARPFSAVDPGNIINITAGAGCTVQRVQIVSQVAGVATFDKSLGVAASTCTGDLGGGLATVGLAVSLSVTSNQIYVQTGTYTLTSTIALGNGSPNNIVIEGYNTVHGDLGTRPLITTATDNTPLFTTSSSISATYIFSNISLSNTAAVRSTGVQSAPAGSAASTVYFFSCLFDGFSKAVTGTITRVVNARFYDSEVKNSTTNGFEGYGLVTLYNSYFHDNVGTLKTSTAGTPTVVRSLLVNGTGHCVEFANGGTFLESTVALCSSNGITTNATGILTYQNNIVYGITGVALQGGVGCCSSNSYFRSNCVGGNGTDRVRIPVGTGDVAPAADPFTNSAGGDFSLNNTAGAGAICRAAGFPGVFPGGTTTGYLDIGATQSQGTGGTSTIVVAPPVSH